ncbi:MAG TPA: hypothetical protein DCL86_16925 [Bacteroidales bacterium]|jgi:hypothetical protein|nr:hypothetical protein [Bacteroidales bacterium]
MKIHVEIIDVQTVNQLEDYWKTEDFKNLLTAFDIQGIDGIKPSETLEYLNMAINDLEPAKAAEIVLQYKLGDALNEGQIQNIAHEMTIDKVSEEYPDPELHVDLFSVNQLLYRAYNGKFPNTEATIIRLKLSSSEDFEVNKEVILKSLVPGLQENNLVTRLFNDQISGEAEFNDAAKVIWEFKQENDTIQLTTSDYWISKQDFELKEFDAKIVFFQSE